MAALPSRSDSGARAEEARAATIDLARAAWLDAKRGRSGSVRTWRAYADTLDAFRAALQQAGLDLASDPRAVALALQAWCGRDQPAPTTFNHRRAVIASFYRFAIQRGLLAPGNPAELVERRVAPAYHAARALDPATVRARMTAIDRATLAGQRDYAILAVALATGRRLREIADLRMRHLVFGDNQVTVEFRRTKGGRSMRDTLPPATAQALLAWLAACYAAPPTTLPPDAPVWATLRRPLRPLSARQIENIARQRLDAPFHALRHTFARAMDALGAPVTVTQARLGHASLATTARYLATLRAADNPYGSAVEALLFGADGAPLEAEALS